MAQRRHHYELAFEDYLRARRIPYVAVNEARRALLPDGARLFAAGADPAGPPRGIKSFDFVVYGEEENLLLDVKGRRLARRAAPARAARRSPHPRPRLESWVTLDDIDSMRRWTGLFGAGFRGAFVFVYWCEEQPPDAQFEEVFERRGRWYAVRAVPLDSYTEHMRVRSPRWRTMHLAAATFERIAMPFCPPIGERPRAGADSGAPATALQPLAPGL